MITLERELGSVPIIEKMVKTRLRWFGHVVEGRPRKLKEKLLRKI